MSPRIITPEHAKRLLDNGAVLVDIRAADEHAREWIPGAHHLPLSEFNRNDISLDAGRPVIFYCRSGARTTNSAPLLASKVSGTCEAFIIEGGLDAWKKAGLPVSKDPKQPLELQRQVQIGAGSMVFLGTLLGILISPWLLAIPAFVGAGLIVAGITGFCGMARLLIWAPWNRGVYGKQVSKGVTAESHDGESLLR